MNSVKKFYHPIMSSGVIRPTCGYGFTVDGVAPNTDPSGHAGRWAIDEGGEGGGTLDWMIVPPAGVGFKCVRITSRWSLNVAMFETVEPVICADGEITVVGLELIHCGNGDFGCLGISEGKVFMPGERFYREGTGGCISAHVHIQAYKGSTGGSWHPCPSGYQMDGEVPLHKVAYLFDGAELWPNGLPYQWCDDLGEEPIGIIVPNVDNLRRRTGPGADYAQPGDGWSNYVQNGHTYAVYELRDGWARITQDGQWICAQYGTYMPYASPAPAESPAQAHAPDDEGFVSNNTETPPQGQQEAYIAQIEKLVAALYEVTSAVEDLIPLIRSSNKP